MLNNAEAKLELGEKLDNTQDQITTMDQALGNLDKYGKMSEKHDRGMLTNVNQLDIFSVWVKAHV